jgi:putative membrane protein
VTADQHRISDQGRASRVELTILGFVYLAVALSLLGFATFGLHPELVAKVPGAAKSYGLVFRHVGPAQVWIVFAALAAVLVGRTGWRWVPAFLAVYAVSFLSEFLGTSYGVPFGGYAYSGLLGPKWFDRVPYVIPVSWFCVAVPSLALAGAARSTVGRVLLASSFLVAWDLALDPAMSFLTPYWTWAKSGPYYGMPWINLAGWFLTAVVLFTAMTLLRADRWVARLNRRWLIAFYAANLLMPLGMLAAAGLWLGVVTTMGALGVLGAVTRLPFAQAPLLVPATDARS